MKLHGFSMSPNTLRARLALEEAGLAYEFVEVDLMSGAQRSDEYLALNPTGRVPALVDGDFILWESNAIVEYAAAKAPELRLGPQTPHERGELSRWMFMNAAHLSPACAQIFAHTIRLPTEQRNPQIVSNARAEVARSLSALDRHLEGRHFIQERFTIADIALGPTLGAAAMLSIDLGATPHVAAWHRRVTQRPAWRKVGG